MISVAPHSNLSAILGGYTIQLSSKLSVWRGKDRICIYDGKLPKPWRIEAGRLKGVQDWVILVGVNKKTWNLPFAHKTIFALGFDGHHVFRRWTGSTMGRPLVDFCLWKDELVTLEKRHDQRMELTVNHWNGFGFRKGAKLGDWASADNLKSNAGRLYLRADGHEIDVRHEN